MMRRLRARAALAALACACTIAAAAPAALGADAPPPADVPARHGHVTGEPDGPTPQSPAFARALSAGMQRMMADMHAAVATGDVDIDFLAMMIPHHAGAIEMARLLLQHGNDAATRRLAEDIIASQTIEIESMQRRLGALRRQRADAAGATDSFPALGGTRGR